MFFFIVRAMPTHAPRLLLRVKEESQKKTIRINKKMIPTAPRPPLPRRQKRLLSRSRASHPAAVYTRAHCRLLSHLVGRRKVLVLSSQYSPLGNSSLLSTAATSTMLGSVADARVTVDTLRAAEGPCFCFLNAAEAVERSWAEERAEPRAAMVFGGGATRGGLERPDASPGGVWSARM